MSLTARWLRTPQIRPNPELDEFEVMPDHMHAILLLFGEGTGAVPKEFRCRPKSLGSTIRGFKAKTTSLIREQIGASAFRVWQPRFFDTIIEDDDHLDRT